LDVGTVPPILEPETEGDGDGALPIRESDEMELEAGAPPILDPTGVEVVAGPPILEPDMPAGFGAVG
jgi:hypothetical protein